MARRPRGTTIPRAQGNGVTNVDRGKGPCTGSLDLGHSSGVGGHASHRQSRSKSAALTPEHKSSCKPRHRRQTSAEGKENVYSVSLIRPLTAPLKTL